MKVSVCLFCCVMVGVLSHRVRRYGYNTCKCCLIWPLSSFYYHAEFSRYYVYMVRQSIISFLSALYYVPTVYNSCHCVRLLPDSGGFRQTHTHPPIGRAVVLDLGNNMCTYSHCTAEGTLRCMSQVYRVLDGSRRNIFCCGSPRM